MIHKPLLSLAALAVTLTVVVLVGSADPTRAQTFNPEVGFVVTNPEPEVPSDVIVTFDAPIGDVNFAADINFFPREWGMIPGDEIPIGASVGTVTSDATLGLINSPCNQAIPVEFDMLNASLDRSDTVSFYDEDDSLTADFAEDNDGNGLDDAIDH